MKTRDASELHTAAPSQDGRKGSRFSGTLFALHGVVVLNSCLRPAPTPGCHDSDCSLAARFYGDSFNDDFLALDRALKPRKEFTLLCK
jgi:hypothetical protein